MISIRVCDQRKPIGLPEICTENDLTELGFLKICTDRMRDPYHCTSSAELFDLYTDVSTLRSLYQMRISHVAGGTLYTNAVYVMESTPDQGCT